MSSVPLCQHLNVSGKPCGSPAQRRRRFCYFHDESRKRARASAQRQRNIYPRSNFLQFPVLEDANAIQVALMQTIDGLLDGRLTDRQTGLLLYALQTASANLKRVTLETEKPEQPEPWVGELLTALRSIPDPAEPDNASVAAGAPPAQASEDRLDCDVIPNIRASAEPRSAGDSPAVAGATRSRKTADFREPFDFLAPGGMFHRNIGFLQKRQNFSATEVRACPKNK